MYLYEFDAARLEAKEKYDCYFLICTNVVGIEDESEINPDKPSGQAYYRDSDGLLSLRPVFHSRQDRIRAHFLICFISLVLERLLKLQLGW